MKLKRIFASLLLAGVCMGALADGPFRNHRFSSFQALPAAQSGDVVFIGNSITNMFNWWEGFGSVQKIHGRGNSGGVTEEVLDNLESMIAGQPSKVFLMIGTNDLGTAGINDPARTAMQIKTIITRIRKESPATEVYYQSILPSGKRDKQKILDTNAAVKAWIEGEGKALGKVTYVDLYAQLDNGNGVLNTADNGTTCDSYDNLHLSNRGYYKWHQKIQEYMPEDCQSVLTEVPALGSNLGGSSGMRSSYFGALPVKNTDVLIIGDEMIHGGEWHELLGSPDFKDRGNGWGYPGVNIANMTAELDAIFSGNTSYGVAKAAPRAVCLYAGVADCNNSNFNATNVKAAYKNLVDGVLAKDGGAPLFLMTLLPHNNAAYNSNAKTLNAYMAELAAANDKVHVIDLYAATGGDNRTAEYFMEDNYVTGVGYVQLANTMADALNPVLSTSYNAISLDDARANVARFNTRKAIGKALNDYVAIDQYKGTGLGQYTEASISTYKEAVEPAFIALQTLNPTSDVDFGAAMTTLKQNINLPTEALLNGKEWAIVAKRNGVYVSSNGVGQGVTGKAANNQYYSRWTISKRSDGSWNFCNKADDSYLVPASGSTNQLVTSATEPSSGWSFSYSDVLGTYIINCGSIQLHNLGQPENKIANWGGGEKRDDEGCLFTLVEIEGEPDILPDTPEHGKVFTIYNDHVGTPYYLNDQLTSNCTALTTTKASDNSQQWIVWGNATDGYEFVNVKTPSRKLTAHSGVTTFDITNNHVKIGNSLKKHGTQEHKAGNCTTLTLSGGKFTGADARFNQHEGKWSTDFAFFATGDNAYKVEGGNVTVAGQNYTNGSWVISATELTPGNVTVEAGKTANISNNVITVSDAVVYTIANYVKTPETTRYLKNENGSLKLVEASTLDASDSKFQWTLRANGTNYDIVSVADGKVLDYSKGLSEAGTPFAKSEGTTSDYSALYNSTMGGGRYLAASADGAHFGTTSGKGYYAQNKVQTNGWSTDFIFTEVPATPGQLEGTEVNVGFSAGTLSGGSNDWRQTWTSSGTPAVTVSAYNKTALVGNLPNAQASSDAFIVYTGNRNAAGATVQNPPFTSYLRVSAPTGYYVTGYSFDLASYDLTATGVTVTTPKGSNYTITSTSAAQSEEYAFADTEHTSFDITLTGENKGIKFTNFKVYVKEAPGAITYTVDKNNGSWSATNDKGTWASKWTSTDGKLTFTASANNMQWAGDYIDARSGQSGSSTYTLTAPEGYLIVSYSFKATALTNDQNWTVGGVTTTVNTTGATIAATDVNKRNVVFSLTGGNTGTKLTEFSVVLVEGEEVPEPDYYNSFRVFDNASSSIPYRIPAIAKNRQGDLIAVADYRHSRQDIGIVNNGALDLHYRIKDHATGKWSDVKMLVEHGQWLNGSKVESGGSFTSFGDPCIVADRTSNKVMVTSCCGNVSFPGGSPSNHQGWSRFISEDGGKTWSSSYIDLSQQVFDQLGAPRADGYALKCFFIGSGKISQSRTIKVGDYYRLYCAALTKMYKNGVNDINCNYVFYSDDFGLTWNLLGTPDDCPIASGDEPKADELPDGSVMVSSRTGGRIFNVYHYTNTREGSGAWSGQMNSGSGNNGTWGANCNGEIMNIPAKNKETGEKSFLLLQSIPRDGNRNYVSIYWKDLKNLSQYRTAADFAPNWPNYLQLSTTTSAYSTMCMDQENNISFFYEENNSNMGYDMIHKTISIEQLTNDKYEYYAMTHADSVAYLKDAVEPLISNVKATNFGPYVGQYAESAQASIEAATEAYKAAPATATYDALNTALATATTRRINPAKQYRLINVGRNGKAMVGATDKFTGADESAEAANQRFVFESAGDGKWYLKSKDANVYFGKLAADEKEVTAVSTTDNAGTFIIEVDTNGNAQFYCTNKTGSHAYIHLAGDNTRLVPWNAGSGSPASQWHILPIEEPLDITNEGDYTYLDVQALNNIVRGVATKDNNESGDFRYNFDAADLNDDGVYTIGDIARLIRLLLESVKK